MKVFTTLGNGIDNLKLSEQPMPVVKEKQILVRMTAASLNYRDLLVINGMAD